LISMEERVRLVNGHHTIRSQPGRGTTVEVFVSLLREE
jgi:signal transduction histidine kinase